MYSSELFSSEFLREKFENDLEILGKTQGIYFLKNVATLKGYRNSHKTYVGFTLTGIQVWFAFLSGSVLITCYI